MAISLLAVLLAVGHGCGAKTAVPTPPPSPPVKNPAELGWPYAPGAVKIGLIADRDLNETAGVPAALSLCLYQLADTAWFQGNMTTSQGLWELSACRAADPPAPGAQAPPTPAGLVSAVRYLIQPGQTMDMVIDRMAGAKFIAVAGGFSSLPPQSGAAFLMAPIHENKKWFFANTFEIRELAAWVTLKRQSLAFFPKEEDDLNRSASDFAASQPQASVTPPAPVAHLWVPPANLPCPSAQTTTPVGQAAPTDQSVSPSPASDQAAPAGASVSPSPSPAGGQASDLPCPPAQTTTPVNVNQSVSPSPVSGQEAPAGASVSPSSSPAGGQAANLPCPPAQTTTPVGQAAPTDQEPSANSAPRTTTAKSIGPSAVPTGEASTDQPIVQPCVAFPTPPAATGGSN